jgi:hypothetical protein
MSSLSHNNIIKTIKRYKSHYAFNCEKNVVIESLERPKPQKNI